jgi:DNA-binding response OmpR family regulator
MSGFELLEHLQTLAPPRPVIFVTAQDEDEVRAQAARNPDNVLLRKPVLGTELLHAVRAQLRRSGFPAQPES